MASIQCLLVLSIILLFVLVKAQDNESFSDKFLMKTNLTDSEVRTLAAKNGFQLHKKVIDGYFLLKKKETLPKLSKKPIPLSDHPLKKHPMIESFEQEKYLKRYKRQINANTTETGNQNPIEPKVTDPLYINDANWRYMWYLQPDTKPSMGIYEAWLRGYTGNGVTIAFIDDGVDTTHSDLSPNYRTDLSYNYVYEIQSPEHTSSDDGHGTCCAGIVSAVKNNLCILGVAYNTEFAALKLLDDNRLHTASDEAMAFNHKLDRVDIYSNSWGPSDDGHLFVGPHDIVKRALVRGLLQGRDGKGAIYVFAAGNGRQNDDDCNCDGYANSIYTITIGSLSNLGKPAYYSEPCTAVLATTYGGDYPNPMIVTTNRSDTCTKRFQGTSAAAPVATGIIALTLQANPNLTWRDVQHLIVETSSNKDLMDPEGVIENGVKRKVSRYHGFGLMNADAMITKALTWKTVPASFYYRTRMTYTYNSGSLFRVSSTVRINTVVRYLEHVTVTVYFRVSTRGNAIFHLTSPSGTRCKLLGSRSRDLYQMFGIQYTTLSSVQTWGEDPSGTWELEMDSAGYFDNVELEKWQLTIYGTVTDPLKGAPTAGSYGGKCLTDNSCTRYTHCCDKNIKLCILKHNTNCLAPSASTTRTTSTSNTTGDWHNDGNSTGPDHLSLMLLFSLVPFISMLM